MAILGAHQSIAGGYHRAVELAHSLGCDCVQLFSKNNSQWRAKAITPAEAEAFRKSLSDLQITHPLIHDSYLINLASPDDELWQKSIDAFVVELTRADQLGIPYVVTHPGAHVGEGEAAGLQRIIQALDEVHRRTPAVAAQCLLENTAGQGSNLGASFEHLAMILAGVEAPQRLGGVCFDTCHALAAGYPLSTQADYADTLDKFERQIGLARLKAFHLNDSKKGLGSRVDRHEHIGQGQLGLEAFRLLLNDPRFTDTPMYLETPKGLHEGEEWDVINLRTLRGADRLSLIDVAAEDYSSRESRGVAPPSRDRGKPQNCRR